MLLFFLAFCHAQLSVLSQKILKHVQTTLVSVSHACDVCSKQFAKTCNLKRNMLIHTGDKPRACDVCGLQFTHAQKLVVVVVLLFYVHGKHLRSCQDGQLT